MHTPPSRMRIGRLSVEHDLEALRAKSHADALLPHALREGVGGHAEDAGSGEQSAMSIRSLLFGGGDR